ncbi:sulfite exporter TauE/SafE family protein [Aquimarina agarivorans]|uniref:sulfite exporter TauE/SafE family protein n=1 Tax=Aquimarina agarivorans TaxID=980584 RepID=UPI000248F60C|nr:sulfite exporter TauE/SafE family protein [Aquimarina agarivorans]
MELKDLVLILVGVVTGFINTVAGGGSVIILPVLILYFGLPPTLANGTNRIGIFIQTIFSAWGFKSKGVSPFVFGFKKSILVGIIALIGAVLGSKIALEIPDALFTKILSVVMIGVLILTLVKPKPPQLLKSKPRLAYIFTLIAFFFIGIYGGFIQAGTGLLLILALSVLNNMSLVKSNALKTIVVFIFTIGTITVFAINDQINYKYGLLLGIGNAIGGWSASRWSVKKGDKAIQIFMVIAVILMAIKLWVF